MNLFTILRHHVATQPNAIASRSSRRVVTYRKFWSRIERATARLKSEWHVEAGDTVVYWGQGHQDALMFYIAVARCGAKLLPLEHASLHENSVAILKNIPAVLLLHDDETIFEVPPAAPVIANLSSLIANRCHHNPPVSEDITSTSLISFTALEDSDLQAGEHSLQQLMENATPYIESNAAQEFRIAEALFDDDVFAPQVLPVLARGGTIIFR
jgi:acyl-CoA synthetase (AMP-forming)/AMP-acid ligase II